MQIFVIFSCFFKWITEFFSCTIKLFFLWRRLLENCSCKKMVNSFVKCLNIHKYLGARSLFEWREEKLIENFWEDVSDLLVLSEKNKMRDHKRWVCLTSFYKIIEAFLHFKTIFLSRKSHINFSTCYFNKRERERDDFKAILWL